MGNEIGRVSVAADRLGSDWGIEAFDYTYTVGGTRMRVDLQDLLVMIAQNRAAAIESEVLPLQDIISRRNTRLEHYGVVLQKLTELQAKYTDTTTSGESVPIGNSIKQAEFRQLLEELGYGANLGDTGTLAMTKAEVEGAVARCKNRIDGMNNDSQRDMTQLQAIVDRRDESFTAASNLMTSVSDTRSTLIKSL